MATSPRGLAFVLTMVAWLAASIHTGSPSSGWWGTQEAYKLRQAAKSWLRQGNFAEAARVYEHIAEVAAPRRDTLSRALALEGAGSARFAIFDYRGALDDYLKGKKLAEQARDRQSVGAIDTDLASLYQQSGDLDSALRLAEEARLLTTGLADVYYRPQLLVMLGRLRGGPGSISLFNESIAATRSASPLDRSRPRLEADALDSLCEALLANGDVKGAEEAARKALALRPDSNGNGLGFSYWLLGSVRLKQAEQAPGGPIRRALLDQAEEFTRQANMAKSKPHQYWLAEQQGRILLAQGRTGEALTALEQAVVQAQRWRLGVAPALSSVDGAATALQSDIFDRFVDTAADYGLRSKAQRWVEESFEATELNRAQNLKDNTQNTRSRTLPLEYWEVLGELQSEQAATGGAEPKDGRLLDQLRLELTELEVKAGLRYSPTIAENFPSHDSLIHFQKSLRDSDLLLSFALGKEESWLWTVARDTVHVYRLPPAAKIVGTVRAFRRAVEAGTQGFEDIGRQLYGMLFGQLDADETAKTAWQLSVEDALLEVPFAALVVERAGPESAQREEGSGHIVFLAEKHSLEIKAGALLSGTAPETPLSGFVSVGDPIYNRADTRWTSQHSTSVSSWLPALFRPDLGSQYNRLPGTRREVEASAAAWGENRASSAMLLEGAAATRTKFLAALSPVPQVIHLATHAVTSSSTEEAYLVFGLGSDGWPQLLSASQIRTLSIPGSVVVMSGCATAPTGVPAGLGMAGLVRAWTIAGAAAVVATEWAVRDSTGGTLLASFYRHFGQVRIGSAAEALRRAQIELMHTPDTAPAEWAAYQVFAGRVGSRNLGSSIVGTQARLHE